MGTHHIWSLGVGLMIGIWVHVNTGFGQYTAGTGRLLSYWILIRHVKLAFMFSGEDIILIVIDDHRKWL